MPIEAVVFDLFGTLVPSFSSSLFERSLGEMADAVRVDHGDFKRMWFDDTAWYRATGRFGSTEANVRYICDELGVACTEAQLADAAAVRLAFSRRILAPRPDAVDTLGQIKSAGLGLALVSDCSAEVPQLWPETPFASLIDVPIFSCMVGTRKPDPRIYRLACDGLRVAPNGCLYVGDGFSRELAGAAAVGMHPVLIAPPGEVSPDTSENEGDIWTGPRIEGLSNVLTLLSPPPIH